MDVFMVLIMVALLVEAVVQTLRMIWDTTTRKISFPVVLSLIVGVGVSWGLKLNIFAALPLSGVPPDWLSYIATGIIISRGASFTHDLWGTLTNYKSTFTPSHGSNTTASEAAAVTDTAAEAKS